jgi:protein-disulfide isomerase
MTQKKVQQQKKQRHRERMAAKQKRQKIQVLTIGTILVLLVIVIGFMVFQAVSGGKEKAQDTAANSETKAIQFPYDKQPVLGDPDAPVKIVEFGDYKCPVCRQFDQQLFPQIKKDFVEKGKAAYYFMNYPIINGSFPAELAGESVYHHQPKLFWKYHEVIYKNQKDEHQDWATTDFLVQLAKKHVPQIDATQLRKDIEQQTYLDDVKADQQKGAGAGVTGTPTVFVNGKIVDEQTTFNYPALKDVINKAYEKAAK